MTMRHPPYLPSPDANVGQHVWLAGVLGNAQDAAVAVLRCRTGSEQDEFFASRALCQAGIQALATLQQSVAALPAEIRRELGGVDWESWQNLDEFMPPITAHRRDQVWEAMGGLASSLLMGLQRLRRRTPSLFNPMGYLG